MGWKILLSVTEVGTDGAFPDASSFTLIIAGSAAVLALFVLARHVASVLGAAAAESRGAACPIRRPVDAGG